MATPSEPVVLTGRDLTAAQVVAVARGRATAVLDADALERMTVARDVVERALAAGETVYGLTTGVGAKKNARVHGGGEHDARLLAAHRVGQGPPLADDVVRAALCILVNGLASARSAARPELAARLIEALNSDGAPHVRTYGTIGMADLSANADLAHGALGDFSLAQGETLALLGNNAVSTGQAALALHDASALADLLDVTAALDLEAFGGSLLPFDAEVGRARPYTGIEATLQRIGSALDGSYLHEPGSARNLQDPLSFRCIPQVHGALRDTLEFARTQLATELNAAQGNPLVDADGGRIVPAGNFDVLPLAQALDFVRIALAPALTSACERTVKLLQRPLTGLPEGLALEPGSADDGLAELGIAVQALTAEARLLAQPVSFESVSTSQAEGIEDRMTLAPLAGRRLADQVGLGLRIAAVEATVAAQAVDLRGASPLGRGTAALHGALRSAVPSLAQTGTVPQDLEPVVRLLDGFSHP